MNKGEGDYWEKVKIMKNGEMGKSVSCSLSLSWVLLCRIEMRGLRRVD